MDIPESLTSLNAAGGDERVNFIIGEIPSDAKSQVDRCRPLQVITVLLSSETF